MKIIHFFTDYYRKNSFLILFSGILFFVALFSLWQITDEIVLEKEAGFDTFFFNFFKDFIFHERLNGEVLRITQFSSPFFIGLLFPAYIVVLLLFKHYRKALFLFAAGAGGMALFSILKQIFARPRPPYPLLLPESGFSFPSGHATVSFVFYGALAYLIYATDLPKFWKSVLIIFLLLLSISIGLSRVYLRVHYPSDVLAGFCLGYSWLFLLIYVFRKRFPLH